MKLLDLFCGAGGAAVGYFRAGFTSITGVDIAPQPRYPYRFIMADALEYLRSLIESGKIAQFDLIHASPPCQAYSVTESLTDGNYPRLLEMTRSLLESTGLHYVIENVPGAPFVGSPLLLCGSMFGLSLIRHRYFENNVGLWLPPRPCSCAGLYAHSSKGKYSSFAEGATAISVAGHNYSVADGRFAMGIDWMTRGELSQAIPPAYTEFVGGRIMEGLRHAV